MDVWQKIVARAASIDREMAHDARRAKEAEKRRKEEIDEVVTIVLALLLLAILVGGMGWFVYDAVQQCGGKCGFQKG